MIEQKVLDHLSKDDKLKHVITTTNIRDNDRDTSDVYFSLIRAIVAQQLSNKAAQIIFYRFISLFEDGYPYPDDLLCLEEEHLRCVGLSKRKVEYIQNVAMFFKENLLFDNEWEMYSNEYIIELLTEIKGVGVWTVQMILIFSLKRQDIFPIGDLAIRQSMIHLYELDGGMDKKKIYSELANIAEQWKPYRSMASRYLWNWER